MIKNIQNVCSRRKIYNKNSKINLNYVKKITKK